MEVRLENMEPVFIPMVARCQVPEIICIKELYKPDEDCQMIRIPAKKNQVRLPPVPFKNLSNFGFSLEI